MSETATARTAVENLIVGQLVDLEGDRYADSDGAHPSYAFELATVIEPPERETPDCVLVHFDGASVGFPTGHLLPTLAG